jgi:hypothetical protein
MVEKSAVGRRTAVNIVGKSGKFSIFDTALGKSDPNAVTIEIDALREVAADGTTSVGAGGNAKHSLETFANQRFTIDDPVDDDVAGVQAQKVLFSTSVNGIGKLEVQTFIFKSSGSVGTDTETWSARVDDVKFNIKLSDWSFCGDTGTSCSQDNSEQIGNYVDVDIKIKGKFSTPIPSGISVADENDWPSPKAFDLGGNIPLQLSNRVFVDGVWTSMPDGYPKMINTGGSAIFTFRFPRFADTAVYDPVVGFSRSIAPPVVTVVPTTVVVGFSESVAPPVTISVPTTLAEAATTMNRSKICEERIDIGYCAAWKAESCVNTMTRDILAAFCPVLCNTCDQTQATTERVERTLPPTAAPTTTAPSQIEGCEALLQFELPEEKTLGMSSDLLAQELVLSPQACAELCVATGPSCVAFAVTNGSESQRDRRKVTCENIRGNIKGYDMISATVHTSFEFGIHRLKGVATELACALVCSTDPNCVAFVFRTGVDLCRTFSEVPRWGSDDRFVAALRRSDCLTVEDEGDGDGDGGGAITESPPALTQCQLYATGHLVALSSAQWAYYARGQEGRCRPDTTEDPLYRLVGGTTTQSTVIEANYDRISTGHRPSGAGAFRTISDVETEEMCAVLCLGVANDAGMYCNAFAYASLLKLCWLYPSGSFSLVEDSGVVYYSRSYGAPATTPFVGRDCHGAADPEMWCSQFSAVYGRVDACMIEDVAFVCPAMCDNCPSSTTTTSSTAISSSTMPEISTTGITSSMTSDIAGSTAATESSRRTDRVAASSTAPTTPTRGGAATSAATAVGCNGVADAAICAAGGAELCSNFIISAVYQKQCPTMCDTCGLSSTSTADASISPTKSKVCNSHEDPEDCASILALCELDGQAADLARKRCPVSCGTCVEAAATTATASTEGVTGLADHSDSANGNASAADPGYGHELRINCGGTNLIDADSKRWLSDTQFLAGPSLSGRGTSTRLYAAAESDNDANGWKGTKAFLQTVREQRTDATAEPLTYTIPALGSRYYRVDLFFVDGNIATQAAGRRMFDVVGDLPNLFPTCLFTPISAIYLGRVEQQLG